MTRVLLLEDEPHSMARLAAAVDSHLSAHVVGQVGSVSEGLAWFDTHPAPDLVIADIELADGRSFDLFERHRPPCPVVFCTAFDAYVLDAFAWNGIDYILKPIRPETIHSAIDRYLGLRDHFNASAPPGLTAARQGTYRRRLILKQRNEYLALPVDQVAYLTTEHKLCVVVRHDETRHLYDATLNELERELDPAQFFRTGRQYILSIDAVTGFEPAGRGRYEVHVQPRPGRPVLVGSKRAKDFLAWLERG